MTLEILSSLFERELNKLKNEVELYENPKRLWIVEKNISNSAGNLTLHLVGNLNHFIGKVLGGTDYTRNRELEFSQRDLLQVKLIKRVEDTRLLVIDTLAKLTKIELDNQYPLKVFDKEMTIGYFLIHLLTHLTYHLGQINYHRRLVGISAESNA